MQARKQRLYQHARKTQRLQRFQNDSSLAHRFNRPQPVVNEIFPEEPLRERTKVGLLETTLGYRAVESVNAFTTSKINSKSSAYLRRTSSPPITQQSTQKPVTSGGSRNAASRKMASQGGARPGSKSHRRSRGVFSDIEDRSMQTSGLAKQNVLLNSDTQLHSRTAINCDSPDLSSGDGGVGETP